ncbi:hypothetical protein MA16_Dca028926 [Dendrobium catenatum]|uniref:Uncharacterized protein n=1 Tax=Dendrobium catenatum TaxID=906689 RepID=A0A2I0VA89_9ASPA|nr:hypothetical protein MA16_Dca028926 [Dendrobium catenatum]
MSEWRSEMAEDKDGRAGRRREVETEAEKSSPTSMAEMEVMKGRMMREAHEEAEEGDEAKARRREFGTVMRMRTPVELRAARREREGLESLTCVMLWETRNRARSVGARRPETSSPSTTSPKGGSPPPLLSLEFTGAGPVRKRLRRAPRRQKDKDGQILLPGGINGLSRALRSK